MHDVQPIDEGRRRIGQIVRLNYQMFVEQRAPARALRRRRPYVIKRRAEDISNQTVNNTIDDDRVARL